MCFETRFNRGGAEFRLYKSPIESVTEGGFMYDISKRYERLLKSVDGVGNENSHTLELNFSEYSLALQLDPFPSDLLRLNYSELLPKQKTNYKKKLVEMVQRQARVAASNYPPNQGPGTQCNNPQSLPFQAAPVTPPPVPRSIVTPPSVCRSIEHQAILDKMLEFQNFLWIASESKVVESQNLEQNLKCLNESRGRFSQPELITPNFAASSMLSFARNLSSMVEKYVSDDSKCDRLRKELKEAELECITDSLTTDPNQQTGRLREEEPRLIAELMVIDTQCSLGYDHGARTSVSSYTLPASKIDEYWPRELKDEYPHNIYCDQQYLYCDLQ
jgi:hypothetical protein